MLEYKNLRWGPLRPSFVRKRLHQWIKMRSASNWNHCLRHGLLLNSPRWVMSIQLLWTGTSIAMKESGNFASSCLSILCSPGPPCSCVFGRKGEIFHCCLKISLNAVWSHRKQRSNWLSPTHVCPLSGRFPVLRPQACLFFPFLREKIRNSWDKY